MKLAQRILMIVVFILSLWNFTNVNNVFAEEVEFSGVTAPIGVNVRDNKRFDWKYNRCSSRKSNRLLQWLGIWRGFKRLLDWKYR